MNTLQALLEMAKRSSPHGFYELAKKKYGAEKVKGLKWPEIAAVAKENDVLIPPYLRTQKVGRGLFNLVPEDHDDNKPKMKDNKMSPAARAADTEQSDREYKAKQDKAAAAKKEEPKKDAVDEAELKTALRELQGLMRDQQKLDRGTTWRMDYQKNGKALTGEVRDWGHWEGDDGSGDYDWQEMTSDTRELLKRLCAKVESWHKGRVKVSYSGGEKNWIELFAEPA